MKHHCPLGSSIIQPYNIRSQTKGLAMRTSTIKRDTAETAVTVEIDLDGTGFFDNETGVGFFDHMLDPETVELWRICDGRPAEPFAA